MPTATPAPAPEALSQEGMKKFMADTSTAFDKMAASIKDLRTQKEEIVTAMKGAVAERDEIQKKLAGLEANVGSWGKAEDWQKKLTELEASVGKKLTELEASVGSWGKSEDWSSGGGSGSRHKPRFDVRQLNGQTYGGEKAKWQEFDWVLCKYVGRESTTLKEAMETAATYSDEITPATRDHMGITEELDSQLAFLLINFSDPGSAARTMLRAIQYKTGLEQYRLMGKDAQPVGGAQETLKLQFLQSPPQASSYKELKEVLIRWDVMLQELEQRRGKGKIMTEEVQATAMLFAAPPELKSEILKKPEAERESYQSIRRYLDDAIYANTMCYAALDFRGTGRKLIGNLQEDDRRDQDQGEDEDGDPVPVQYLNPATGELEVMAVERRAFNRARDRKTGRYQPQKKKGGTAGGGGNSGNSGEPTDKRARMAKMMREGRCFLCERMGHRTTDCSHDTKEDGKPSNPRRTPKTVNTANLEASSAIDLTSFDLCPLECREPQQQQQQMLDPLWLNSPWPEDEGEEKR